jgi:hypothetical protein
MVESTKMYPPLRRNSKFDQSLPCGICVRSLMANAAGDEIIPHKYDAPKNILGDLGRPGPTSARAFKAVVYQWFMVQLDCPLIEYPRPMFCEGNTTISEAKCRGNRRRCLLLRSMMRFCFNRRFGVLESL